MKLKNVQAYPINGVPDHLVHECQTLAQDMAKALFPITKDFDPNIILGAVTFLHAAMIKELISDKPEELAKAAKLCAIGLIKNVEFLSGIKVIDEQL